MRDSETQAIIKDYRILCGDLLDQAKAGADFAREVLETSKARGDEITSLTQRLAAIEALCRRYDSPAVNVGAHALAHKILAIIAEKGK